MAVLGDACMHARFGFVRPTGSAVETSSLARRLPSVQLATMNTLQYYLYIYIEREREKLMRPMASTWLAAHAGPTYTCVVGRRGKNRMINCGNHIALLLRL